MTESDWTDVAAIYAEGLATGHASFETNIPTWGSWDGSHLRHSRFVARSGETVVGWAALTGVSDRCVYGGVAEVSIYVGAAGRGRGIGDALLKELIESSEENNIWTIQAGIFPENTASVRLHLKNGFREIGKRERIGKLEGVWRDTLLLERRSQIIGLD